MRSRFGWQDTPERTHGACGNQGCCAAFHGCTTEELKTHQIDLRVVRYRWHPWCGREVVVTGAFGRGGTCVLCYRTEGGGPVPLEIPEWMFDVQSCATAAFSAVPAVDSATLCALEELLNLHAQATRSVVEAQHHCPNSGGDADANDSGINRHTDRSLPRARGRKRSPAGDQSQNSQSARPNVPRIRGEIGCPGAGRHGGAR